MTAYRANRRQLLFVALAVLTVMAFPGIASAEVRHLDRAPYASETAELTLSFLARDMETGIDYVLEGSDLDTRHTPFSTFKIPNLLIALETEAATSLDEWRDWDPSRRPPADHWPDAWRESQNLGAAFKRSSVWYFQDLALEIGGPTYRDYLTAWNYGNAAAPDGSDDFWLTGELLISVGEQVSFLEAVLSGELDITPSALDALMTASDSGVVGEATVHGKTGSGPDDPANIGGSFSGWYAGYLSREDAAPVVFALHVAGPSFRSIRHFRTDFAVRLLTDMGLIDNPR